MQVLGEKNGKFAALDPFFEPSLFKKSMAIDSRGKQDYHHYDHDYYHYYYTPAVHYLSLER